MRRPISTWRNSTRNAGAVSYADAWLYIYNKARIKKWRIEEEKKEKKEKKSRKIVLFVFKFCFS